MKNFSLGLLIGFMFLYSTGATYLLYLGGGRNVGNR